MLCTGLRLSVRLVRSYRGGGFEDLEACAASRHVTALYAPDRGDYVSYILEAAKENEAFRALFPDGLPAATPLIVVSEGPPSTSPVPTDDTMATATSQAAASCTPMPPTAPPWPGSSPRGTTVSAGG